jgi:TonB family protein
MRKVDVLLELLFLLSAISVGLGEGGPADQQLLVAASDLVNIRSDGAKPLQLEAVFNAQFNTPQEGHFTWKWVARDLWSEEITLGDFGQLGVRKGDTLYVSRNAPFTPLRITELQDLLTVFSVDVAWQIKKIKHEVEGGIDAECVQVRLRPGSHVWNPKRELCINQTNKEVLTDEAIDDQEYRRKEFSDYQPFREHSYPRQARLLVDGSQALKVKIISLREATFDEAVFVPPSGAVARRQCEHMTHPVALKTPDPAYPRSAAQNRMGGTATVTLTVLPDGSVENVQLVGSAGKEMDQVTLETVRNWKFRPAMCGSEAVAFDIRVSVNFQMR